MDAPLSFRTVLRRAAILYAASLAVLALAAGGIWWHHARIAQRCAESASLHGQAATCYYRTVYFGPSWLEAIALLLLPFALCMVVAWVWSHARLEQAD